jgi:hypothetical protein
MTATGRSTADDVGLRIAFRAYGNLLRTTADALKAAENREVGGSIPPLTTKPKQPLVCGDAGRGLILLGPVVTGSERLVAGVRTQCVPKFLTLGAYRGVPIVTLSARDGVRVTV